MHVSLLFTVTILLSAFLLFLIQPMMAKLVLPYLGGAPAVWQTAMLFFQATLLGGYLYAHVLRQKLGTRKHGILHIGLLAVSLICLPLTIHSAASVDPAAMPIRWLFLTLLFSVGLPFFLLSSNAPLIQHWYAEHPHSRGRDPYWLYSASNAGSLIALLAFPFLLEPLFDVPYQTGSWSVLYILFVILVISSIWHLRKHSTTEETQTETVTTAIPWRTKCYWLFLAFLPSSMMLGVTTYVTTDIAAVPLFWIIPLALYLLSFVFTFSPRMPFFEWCAKEQPIAMAILLGAILIGLDQISPLQTLHFVFFFICAMVCHGQLARHKPDSAHLTQFYVWMSLGGVMGGIFNALLAPQLFVHTSEYSIVLCLVCFIGIKTISEDNERWERIQDFLIPAALAVLLFIAYSMSDWLPALFPDQVAAFTEWYVAHSQKKFQGEHIPLFLAIGAAILYLPRFAPGRPLRFGLYTTALIIALPYSSAHQNNTIVHEQRNFFGVSRVFEIPERNLRTFVHGTTLHGMQPMSGERLNLTSYYYPMLEVLDALPKHIQTAPMALGGLGTGTLTCLGAKDQPIDIFEIDEAVLAIASDTRFFTYLSDCPMNKNIRIVDARIGINEAPDGQYGILIMDAYSSDALPMHLMTTEALSIYLSKLQPGGIMAFHISNRYLSLAPILANIADALNLVAVEKNYGKQDELRASARWVLMARKQEDFGTLPIGTTTGWHILTGDASRAWTDHYSNILEALAY